MSTMDTLLGQRCAEEHYCWIVLRQNDYFVLFLKKIQVTSFKNYILKLDCVHQFFLIYFRDC